MTVDYESLIEVGSFMGSGGMIVMDETSCMVDVARYFMDFCREESCGKCTPCRVGTTQLFMLLDAICHGEATMADLAQLERLGGHGPSGPACAAWGRVPRTRSSAPCATSARNTSPTSSTALSGGGVQLRSAPAYDRAAVHRRDRAPVLHERRPYPPHRRCGRRRHRGSVDPRGRPGERHRHPHHVPPRRPVRHRRLPAVRGRGRRLATS